MGVIDPDELRRLKRFEAAKQAMQAMHDLHQADNKAQHIDPTKKSEWRGKGVRQLNPDQSLAARFLPQFPHFPDRQR